MWKFPLPSEPTFFLGSSSCAKLIVKQPADSRIYLGQRMFFEPVFGFYSGTYRSTTTRVLILYPWLIAAIAELPGEIVGKFFSRPRSIRRRFQQLPWWIQLRMFEYNLLTIPRAQNPMWMLPLPSFWPFFRRPSWLTVLIQSSANAFPCR